MEKALLPENVQKRQQTRRRDFYEGVFLPRQVIAAYQRTITTDPPGGVAFEHVRKGCYVVQAWASLHSCAKWLRVPCGSENMTCFSARSLRNSCNGRESRCLESIVHLLFAFRLVGRSRLREM